MKLSALIGFVTLLQGLLTSAPVWATTPVQYDAYANRISLGELHGCVLITPQTIRCWGSSNSGETSVVSATAIPFSKAVKVAITGDFKAIGSGTSRNCALTRQGQVKCWGDNTWGAAGAPAKYKRVTSERGNLAFDKPLDFGAGRTVTQLVMSSQASHTCVILDDGMLKCWGLNQEAELGQGYVTEDGAPGIPLANIKPVNLGTGRKVVQAAVSWTSTCVLLDDGQIKCFGSNRDGLCASDNRELIGTSKAELGSRLLPVNLGHHAPVRQIACGFSHCCALFRDDRIKCWGDNSKGQLGTGDSDNRGLVASRMGDALPYVDTGLSGPIVRIALGAQHTCAFNNSNLSKCWGTNYGGTINLPTEVEDRGRDPIQMGDNLEFVDFGTLSPIRALVASGMRTCEWTQDNKITCVGISSAKYLNGPFDLSSPSVSSK